MSKHENNTDNGAAPASEALENAPNGEADTTNTAEAPKAEAEPEYSEEASFATIDAADQKHGSNSGVTFKEALRLFITSTRQSMDSAKLCADMALTHLKMHRDTVYLQAFDDAMTNRGKNYIRRVAFRAWVEEFAPVKIENNRYSVDKEREAEGFTTDNIDLEKAAATPFWDFKPEKEPIKFTSDEFLKYILGAIGKFRNEKHVPVGNAMDMVNDVEKAVKTAQALRVVDKPQAAEKTA